MLKITPAQKKYTTAGCVVETNMSYGKSPAKSKTLFQSIFWTISTPLFSRISRLYFWVMLWAGWRWRPVQTSCNPRKYPALCFHQAPASSIWKDRERQLRCEHKSEHFHPCLFKDGSSQIWNSYSTDLFCQDNGNNNLLTNCRQAVVSVSSHRAVRLLSHYQLVPILCLQKPKSHHSSLLIKSGEKDFSFI